MEKIILKLSACNNRSFGLNFNFGQPYISILARKFEILVKKGNFAPKLRSKIRFMSKISISVKKSGRKKSCLLKKIRFGRTKKIIFSKKIRFGRKSSSWSKNSILVHELLFAQ